MASKSTGRPLPGRQPLSREFVLRHQRARVVSALAQEVSERGYQAVTVAAIVKRAGIARNTFYENFSGKEECFLAAQNLAMEAALKRVVEAAGEIEDWPRRVVAGLAALLDFVVEEPALARTCIVEALGAGPAAVKQHEESLRSFIALFKLGRDVSPYVGQLPETLEEATIGGVFWIVHRRLLDSADEEIKGLLPGLVEFVLAPYIGVDTAKDLSTRLPLLQKTG
ncbi:MAG: TetR/AcrR family transcriptional regulator [Solirubrobacterales bacterium]